MVGGFSLSSQSISHLGHCANSVSRELAWRRARCRINRVGTKSSKIYASMHSKMDNIRVFVVSDLHTDYAENMAWVKCICSTSHQDDILLVAGDVAETYDNFFSTMSLLTRRFKHVFFVPGNHDLWCRKESEDFLDSLDKLNVLLRACGELGVVSSPLIIGDLGIIPLFSWYHEVCKDFHACRWSAALSDRDDSLAQYFDAMNEKHAHTIEEIQRKCEKARPMSREKNAFLSKSS